MYTYFKKLVSGQARPATVEVYLLRVKERLKKWPERNKRKLSWVSTKEAVALVEEPGIVPLLLRLAELEDDLANPPRHPYLDPETWRPRLINAGPDDVTPLNAAERERVVARLEGYVIHRLWNERWTEWWITLAALRKLGFSHRVFRPRDG